MNKNEFIGSSLKLNFSVFCVALFLVFVYFYKNGYLFDREDLEEVLPIIYKQSDQSLYSNDFYVSHATSSYTVRSIYVWTISTLQSFVEIKKLFFSLCIICIFVSFVTILKIHLHFTNSLFSASIFLYISIWLSEFTLGANEFQDYYLTPACISMMFAYLSLLFVLKDRKFIWAISLILATYFQLIIGIQIFLFCLFWLIIENKWKQYILSSLVYLCCISPHFLFIFSSQMGEFSEEQYSNILFYFRNPHHYIPSSFPLKNYIYYGIVVAILGICSILFKNKNKIIKWAWAWVLFSSFGLLFYYFFFEVLHITFVGKSQWAKTTVWSTLFIYAALSSWLRIPNFLRSYQISIYQSFAIGLLSILLFYSMMNGRIKSLNKIDYGSLNTNDIENMHFWIKTNTPKNAVFLSFPTDFGFLCQSQRSAVVSYKAIIHNPHFILPWFQRVSELYGADLDQIHTPERNVQELQNIWPKKVDSLDLIKYSIDYIITDKLHPIFLPNLRIVHTEGDYYCYLVNRNT